MKSKFYIGDAGPKNPGLTALLRLALWNVVENDLSGDADLIRSVEFDSDGIYLVPEGDRRDVLDRLIVTLRDFVPDCVEGLERNAAEAGSDPGEYVESIVNGGDEESGLFPVDGANFKLGDEDQLVQLLDSVDRSILEESLAVLSQN